MLRQCAEETAEQIKKDTTPEPLDGPIGYWYFKIEPESSFRMDFVDKIVDRPWFENFIMVCILLGEVFGLKGHGSVHFDTSIPLAHQGNYAFF